MILRTDMNLHLRIIQVLALLTTRTFKQADGEEDTVGVVIIDFLEFEVIIR